ncbi:MAG: hypothetical protein M1816_001611 [Peltula sp. TS41687]|nr:MAG: hypothetical protein M1816_001611 [Peltula sp. TS41687]
MWRLSGSTLQLYHLTLSYMKIFADPRTLVKEEARPKSLLIKENPSQKSYIHLQSDWFKEQLLPRERLNKLIDIYHGHLDKALSWKDLPSAYVLSSKACLDIKTISLQAFCRYTVSHCSINTFFGEKLLLVAPSFARDYQKYEDDSWKIFYHFPHILAKDLHKAKKSAIDGLVKFLSLPEEQRADLAWIFQTMNRELQYLTLDSCDIAGIIMLIAWAINNNAHKLCFWIFAHALCNPPLLASLRAETDKACSPDGSVDIDTLISECPQLDAVWWEALRVYNAASVVRKAEADCMVGGKIIHSGDTVLGPFRQFHLNTGIFGENACAFDSGRFLKNRNLQRTRGYAPFGGGHTYCPGRLFAQREVYLLIAMTLYRFDLALEPQQGTGGLRVPAVDIDRPSAAAMGPATDLLVGVKPRAVEAKA